MDSKGYMDYRPNEYDRPRSGSIQTRDEAMGIHKDALRVSNLHRDDVRNHIDACEVYGYLNKAQADARKDAVDKAQTEGDLIHLARDLPGREKLAALKARKPERPVSGSAKAVRWLTTVKFGRVWLHSSTAVFALLLGLIPSFAIGEISHGHTGPVGVGFSVATAVIGFVLLIVNLCLGIDWFDKNG